MTRWPPKPRPAPTASWPEANRSFVWGGGTPLAGAQRGSPSPNPTPSPNARYSGRWRLRMRNGLPSLTVPRHTTKTTIKKLGPQAAYGAKAAGRMASNTPPRVRKNIYLKTRPAPLPGKNEGSAKSTAKYKEPSSSALPGQLPAFRQAHTPATPPLTKASFPATSPRPSSSYLGGPAAKAARRITRHCQKTIRAVFGGWGSLRGKGPFFRQKRALPPQIHLSVPPTHHSERTKSRMRSSL